MNHKRKPAVRTRQKIPTRIRKVIQSLILIVAFSTHFYGCLLPDSESTGGVVSSGGSTTTTPSPSTPTNTACTKHLLSNGQPGIVTAVSRAAFSDTKMIPTTIYPATAFIDPNNLSVKFSYFDGNDFRTEVVSGDGNATYVKLVWLSDLTPLVFWINSTATPTAAQFVKMAARSAPITTDEATWTAGIIEKNTIATATKTLEVEVSPLDQVGVNIISYNATATAGIKPKFAYCSSGCSSANNYNMMIVGYVKNSLANAAITSVGMSWCKVNATTFYPAITYSTTTTTEYAICRNPLSQCNDFTKWTSVAIGAATSVGTKLILDSTITGDIPKVAVAFGGATQMKVYKMGTTACDQTPVALTTNVAVGAAGQGDKWLSFKKDSSSKFHLSANTSTTSVAYINSQTTDPTGAWNTAFTLDTITLPAASAASMTIDTLSTPNRIFTAYGINVAPFEFRLMQIPDITIASSAMTANQITRSDIDLSGNIQLAANQLKNLAIARTSTGKPAAVVINYSNTGANTAGRVEYYFRTANAHDAVWSTSILPQLTNPMFPSIAFDNDDKPWIGIYDNATAPRFYLFTSNTTDGSSGWTSYEFPWAATTGAPLGAPSALPAANQTAIAMYNTGGKSHPMMIVIDNVNAGGTKAVKAAVLNIDTRQFTPSLLTSVTTLSATGASHLSADYDSTGNIVISFQDLNVSAKKVFYAMTSNGGATWSTPRPISQSDQGEGASIKLNGITKQPSISYYYKSGNALFYSKCSDTPTNCATSATWTPTAISTSAGVSTIPAASEQLLSTSMIADIQGLQWVLFPLGKDSGGKLMMATNILNSSALSTIDDGSNGSLDGAPIVNYGIAGWNVAATTNASNLPVGVYLGTGNRVFSFSCGD